MKGFRLRKFINHSSEHVCFIVSRFKQMLLCSFPKFRKATINYVTRVRPSDCLSFLLKQLDS
jgi:hypothetical protein